MSSPAVDPLVVTLRCAGPGWQYCQMLRTMHFPKERNIVPAHVALFHHLPGEELERISSFAQAAAPARFDMLITHARSLGRGVALVIDAPPLIALHRALSRQWQQWLTPQDRQKFSPHVTIQNKADPQQARELLRTLESGFAPFSFDALGLDIWHYRNGPWEPAAYIPFRS